MQVVTAAQMRELDRRTIELGTPGLVLMERAGEAVVSEILSRFRAACRRGVLVVAGRGNNGGDGLVVARLLRARGFRSAVVLLAARDRLRGDARTNLEAWTRARGRLVEVETEEGIATLERELERCGLVVDAILGTGLNARVEGLAAAAIAAIGRATARTARPRPGPGGKNRVGGNAEKPVVAVDLPSGLDADSGEPRGSAVHATATVTFGLAKQGLALPAARSFVGRLVIADIGLAPEALSGLEPGLETATAEAMASLVPRRTAGAHKGTNGHLLIAAGSPGKSGAAVLAGLGALRGGAGLVSIACSAEVQRVVAATVPELMTEVTDGIGQGDWDALLGARSALVVGPGLGIERAVQERVRRLAGRAGIPVVIDADGLNALASHVEGLCHAPAPRVLTPHPGEMARLCGSSIAEIQRDRLGRARELSRATGAVVVLKGAGTVVAAPDGRATLNTTGGPLLGVGGTGDVLAGLIGALLAQGLAAYDAARLGAWLHGRAGDRIAERLGDSGLLASELAAEIPLARRELRPG